jgi:virulence factor Mce-like protein
MKTRVRRRLQGVAFLVVLVTLLGLAVAAYNKAFTDVAMVRLEADSVGNQLQEASDVKMRGVIVGEVRTISATAEGATLELAIAPEHLDQIPADVTARLLPKTLFGERFVALQAPNTATGESHLKAGDVIPQDRTDNAIELQRVIDDLLPLLRAVQPQDLAYTLGAVADALRGRGNELGENLTTTGDYFGEINSVMPELQADISGLADFADTYDAAADDLLDVLDDLSVTNSTVVDQREQLRRTFAVGTSSSNTTAAFLETNEQNLISLAETSRPLLGLFAEYSPEYPCLLEGLAESAPMIGESFGTDGDPALNLNIVFTLPPRAPYEPGDQPIYDADAGPACRALDDIDGAKAAAQNGEYYCPAAPDDGVNSPEGDLQQEPVCYGGGGGRGSSSGGALGALGNGVSSPVGSTAELDFVRGIIGMSRGTDPDEVSDLSAATLAPLLRGNQVMFR